jgi:hypothetical protein
MKKLSVIGIVGGAATTLADLLSAPVNVRAAQACEPCGPQVSHTVGVENLRPGSSSGGCLAAPSAFVLVLFPVS